MNIIILTPDLPGAACTQDPDAFHAGKTDHATVAHAKTICASCPSLRACLQWALDTRQPDSVWGGLTVDERKKLIRNRKRPSRGKATCVRGHDTTGPDARDASNRCRECRREDKCAQTKGAVA